MPPPEYSETVELKPFENNQVRPHMLADIFLRLKLVRERPSVDAFASPELHLFSVWFGPGSLYFSDDISFTVDWLTKDLRWMNPPFSRLKEVVDKLYHDQARAVLVFSHWTSHEWFNKLRYITKEKYDYRPGTKLFESQSGPMPGTRWPCYVALVDASRPNEKPAIMSYRNF